MSTILSLKVNQLKTQGKRSWSDFSGLIEISLFPFETLEYPRLKTMKVTLKKVQLRHNNK